MALGSARQIHLPSPRNRPLPGHPYFRQALQPQLGSPIHLEHRQLHQAHLLSFPLGHYQHHQVVTLFPSDLHSRLPPSGPLSQIASLRATLRGASLRPAGRLEAERLAHRLLLDRFRNHLFLQRAESFTMRSLARHGQMLWVYWPRSPKRPRKRISMATPRSMSL